jgi:hypothetical protein
MAIAFVRAGRDTATTFAFDATGCDCLVLTIATGGGATGLTATFNGTSMTSKVFVDVPVAGDGHKQLTLLNPTQGSYNIVISGATSPDSTVVGYSGVGAVSGGTSSTGTSPVTHGSTVSVANSWVVSASRRRLGPVASTPSTGVTNDRTTSNAAVGVGDSGPEAVSTVNHTWSGGSSDMSVSSVVLEPGITNYTLDCASGSFVLTGNNATFGRIYTLICETGRFLLTGFDMIIGTWVRQSKNTSSFSNESKNTSTWTNENKN